MPDHDHRPHIHAEAPHEDHRREEDCPGDEDAGEIMEPDFRAADEGSGGNSPPPSPPKPPKPPVIGD